MEQYNPDPYEIDTSEMDEAPFVRTGGGYPPPEREEDCNG